MRIAVCFSGQIRTGIAASKNILRFIGDMLPNCDFFVHTWDINSNKPYARQTLNDVELLRFHDNTFAVNSEVFEQFSKIYNPKNMIIESYSDYRESSDDMFSHVVWYTTGRSFELKQQHEQQHNFKYDFVIKIRPDVIFHPKRLLHDEIQNSLKDSAKLYSDVYADHRLDDVFWISNSEVSDKLAKLYSHMVVHKTYLRELKHDPSSFVKDFLANNGIKNTSTITKYPQYSIYRYEALPFDPISDYDLCREIDLLYFSALTRITEQRWHDYKQKNLKKDA